MGKQALWCVLCICCGIWVFDPILFGDMNGETLIDEDLRSGRIDFESATIYRAYAFFEPSRLPPRYGEQLRGPRCGTPEVLEMISAWPRLSKPTQLLISAYFQRPSLDRSYLTPSGHVRIHYTLSGTDAVNPSDTDNNSVPDYVDVAAAAFDSVWAMEVGHLGYNVPLSDGNRGGGPELDVYIVDLGSRNIYGYTYPDIPGSKRSTSSSYIEVDNNYEGGIYRRTRTRGLDALKVTAAHEFFHALQFAYYDGTDARWWQEATATWMEDVVYDEINDYYQYLPHFFSQPQQALDKGNALGPTIRIFGVSIFAHYLAERFGPDVIQRIWEEFERQTSGDLSAFDRAIPTGLEDAIVEFAIWNWFTGERSKPDGYYSEGPFYPKVASQVVEVSEDSAATGRGVADHLAASYLHIEPTNRTGGLDLHLNLDKNASWQVSLLLIDPEQVRVERIDRDLAIPSWNQYRAIVIIPTVTSKKGFNYTYTYSIAFDPRLISSVSPKAFALGQNYPNPFVLPEARRTAIPFDLAQFAQEVRLSIYAASGELVKAVFLRDLAAQSYSNRLAWDGTNQRGNLVASGVYYYRLDVDGRSTVRKMAVIRKK